MCKRDFMNGWNVDGGLFVRNYGLGGRHGLMLVYGYYFDPYSAVSI